MGIFQKLFQQTFIYGLATVLPRMLSFLLVPLYTGLLPTDEYGKVSLIFAYFILLNVFLSYGMETAFFRFFNTEKEKDKVISTSAISILISTVLFFCFVFFTVDYLSIWLEIKASYLKLMIGILALDALVIIPFAWLRASERPIKYAVIKILNVSVNFGLNIFFLVYLLDLTFYIPFLNAICKENFEVHYIFISNLIASGLTFLLLLYFYRKLSFNFDRELWKRMIRYGTPVLVAGVAYSINETFDRILLERLLDDSISEHVVGVYSACYKLAVFMTLFATAFRLGIEPFFFKYAVEKDAKILYAKILRFFVAFGSFILLGVVTFIHILKVLFLKDPAYWEALLIVPVILLANFCLGIYHNLSVWYKITDRTRYGAIISTLGALLTLVLNLVLIPIITYKGSALATLAAYCLMMVLSWYYGRKHYPIPYDLKRIGIYLLVSISFSAISFYGFNSNYMVSIPLFLTFLLILYAFEKDELKRIFKKGENV